jgi:autotransporter-associated beta strand protein
MDQPTPRRTAHQEFHFTNRLVAPMIACGLTFFIPRIALGGSATWDLNPSSNDWNTAANWTPMTVPNGATDTATFALSNFTDVSISANTEVNSIIFTPAANNPYTISATASFTLTISGAGITNNSGIAQHFVTAGGGVLGRFGQLFFTNSATAGSSIIFTNNAGTFNGPFSAGLTEFFNTSTAGRATFITTGSIVDTGGFTNGKTLFTDNSTAANGSFINNGGATVHGLTEFHASSTAANGTFTNKGSTVGQAGGGLTQFFDASTAANGTFINEGSTTNNGPSHGPGGEGGGLTFFLEGSTAANGTFTNNGGTVDGADGGSTQFFQTSTAANGIFTNNGGMVAGAEGGATTFGGGTAGNGTFINNGATLSGAEGGATVFTGSGTADSATLIANTGTGGGQGGEIVFTLHSTGGTSRVELFGNGSLDISSVSFQTPGGVEAVTIGSMEGDGNAFLGRNNLIVGSNNLSTTFAGVIQDGGRSNLSGGSLSKVGSGILILSGTNTYSGATRVNGGVLQMDGSITSNTFVNHGGTLAGTGTVIGNVTNNYGGTVSPGDAAGTLTVNSYTQMSGSTLLIDIAGVNAGQFSVLDVLGNANLNPNALLLPVLQDGFVPTVGESFTFMDYSALTGAFFIFDRNIDDAMEHWNVTYQSNNAVLTVAPGNVAVPDQGSTLLLLTLSLLGLATYRQKCRE